MPMIGGCRRSRFGGRIDLMRMAVRAAGAARRGTGLAQSLRQGTGQGFGHDLLDGARTAAALGGTAETAINLLRRARSIRRGGHGSTNVVVAQHVTGTNNHDRRVAR